MAIETNNYTNECGSAVTVQGPQGPAGADSTVPGPPGADGATDGTRRYNLLSEVNALTDKLTTEEYKVTNDGLGEGDDVNVDNNGIYNWDGTSATVDFNRDLDLNKEDLSADVIDLANDFTSNINAIESFNGGVASHDAVNNRARIVVATVDDGCKVTPDSLVNGAEYLITLDIDVNDITIVSFFKNNNADGFIADITNSGIYTFKVTSDLTGSFPFFWFRPRSDGEFYINSIEFLRLNKKTYVLNLDFNESQPVKVQEFKIFSGIPTSVSAFNGGQIATTGGRLRVITSSGNRGVQFGELENDVEYVAKIKLDLNGLPYVKFLNYFDNEIQKIESNKEVNIRFTKLAQGGFPNPILAPDQAGTFFVESVTFSKNDIRAFQDDLKKVEAKIFDVTAGNNDERIQIGEGANATEDGQTIVGSNATSNQGNATIIGKNADGTHIGSYGCVSDDEQTAIGEGARPAGWRTTAIGAKSFSLGQSSTAISTGSESTTSHGTAIGRGSILNYINDAVALGGRAATKLFMGSTWAHRFKMPFSSIGTGHDNKPKDRSVEISGHNAWDARPFLYDAGETYAKFEQVVYDGYLFVSQISNNTGNIPPSSGNDANWHNVTSLYLETYRYYPTGQIASSPAIVWASGLGLVGRCYSYNGDYYLLKNNNDLTTTPDANSSFVNVTPSFSNGLLRADYFKYYDPSSYDIGEVTIKWETIWISKVNGNTTTPPSDRQDNAQWHAVYQENLKLFWINYDLFRHFDTRHEVNIEGGDLDLLAGRGTGSAKGGIVNIKTHKANLSETDGNNQGDLENVAQFHSETSTDTRFRLLDNATGQMQDVKYYVDGSNRKVLFIED